MCWRDGKKVFIYLFVIIRKTILFPYKSHHFPKITDVVSLPHLMQPAFGCVCS